MRNFITFILCIASVIGCNQGKDVKSTAELLDTKYSITGYIQGAKEGTKFVLVTLGADSKPDTAIFKGDNFEFTGSTPEPVMGQIYFLNETNNASAPLNLVIENAVINIEGKIDSLPDSKVIGGLENSDFSSLKTIIKLYTDSMNGLAIRQQELSGLTDTLPLQQIQQEYNAMERETRNAIQQYAIEHPKSISSAYFILKYYSSNTEVNQLDSVYNSYDSSIHTSTYVQRIKAKLDVAKRTAIGQVAPELNLNNEKFDTVKLASYKGKYLLIDFWASWCQPCRTHNPQIVQTYIKYKSKGFDIVGVSLDTLKKNWQTAIKKDKLLWMQVSDLKGWQSSVVPLYGISAIPANVLLNKEGKIIAKNIPAESLEATLQELIK